MLSNKYQVNPTYNFLLGRTKIVYYVYKYRLDWIFKFVERGFYVQNDRYSFVPLELYTQWDGYGL